MYEYTQAWSDVRGREEQRVGSGPGGCRSPPLIRRSSNKHAETPTFTCLAAKARPLVAVYSLFSCGIYKYESP